MKKYLLLVLLASSTFFWAQDRPKLVVGIVVDQMKMEYLYRFSDDFSNNGFKRLMKNGFTYHNMHYNYMPTYTAPGHASIYTGTTPSIHGIVGNEWYNKAIGKEIYCTDDANVQTLGGGTESEGKMSPKNLQATTITDELKLATNFKGKVIGISLKDRGAILPAGHFADWAFWFSGSGSFISSTFYGKQLPKWVDDFNSQKNYLYYLNSEWKLLKPKEVYNESLTDNNPYEGKLFKKQPFFPYGLKEMYESNDAGVLRSTPFGNNFILDFTKRAIIEENLGKDEITDFLTISFSSTDYIGHLLGPRSIEIQDTYLRLDETIGDLLNYLDSKVGKNNYLIFLTADHAGAENVTYLKDNHYEVENIFSKDFENLIHSFSETQYGADIIENISNYNIFFNHKMIHDKRLDLPKVKNDFKKYLYSLKYVKTVYNDEDVLRASGHDNLLNMVSKGYDPVQNGDLVVLFKPGYVEYSTTGTTHGSPYTYDTHVPLIFYGWNIKRGESHDKKVITEIAPTLAQKLKVQFPNGTDAIVLKELFNQ